ncbi:MAG: hypothetical protein JNK14_05465 [Chitinophagaceae bacterium]|nr:hypothetical protein [Chitinophagaceae bacterium]
MKRIYPGLLVCLLVIDLVAQPINRKALVERHTVVVTQFDSLSSLSVGNGKFAFTVDATGLQTFPEYYAKGVALGTQSEWGWHSFPSPEKYTFDETLKNYKLNGREVSYSVQLKDPKRSVNAVNWFRQNPHRLQLGNIGFDITKNDGSLVQMSDIKNIRQELNMWTGEITSQFSVEGVIVKVSTFCNNEEDAVSAKVESPLINSGRLKIRLRFPYPTGEWKDVGTSWGDDAKHRSIALRSNRNGAEILHQIDTTKYYTWLWWNGNGLLSKKKEHYYTISPDPGQSGFSFTVKFTGYRPSLAHPLRGGFPVYKATGYSSKTAWEKFWNSGGAIDFSGSTDKRAFELERRIILSQYLARIQCAGSYPPQETGLTYNSWYGKPHLEMHWWHGIHFALWGRTELLEKSLSWYAKVANNAKAIAKRQGYDGLRWQKMTDNHGEESPSSVGAFLIWQQPHYIYFTELCYRAHPDKQTLDKYKELVFATADFMASYAHYDSAAKKYILGKGVIAAQERFKAEETFNPTYELVYWHWALNIAQQWRERAGLPRNKKWDNVLAKLSPLPVQDSKYLFTESGTDSYTNPEYRTDHPSVFGAWGMLPKTPMLDSVIMKNTFDWIWDNWAWKDTWGWDFPMTAMTATRLGLPDKAMDALLMPIQTNTYLVNGHNYQDDRLTIYLPGNGGILAAIAMMCAGYEQSSTINPGIPKNGAWKVRWEGLRKMF